MMPEPRMARARATAALVALSLCTTGCGFLFTQGPPSGYESQDYFACTESNTGPILDVIWGGLNVVGALMIAADPDAYTDANQAIAIGLGWGVVSGAAAGVGFRKTQRCRDARQEWATRTMAGQAAGPTGGQNVQAVTVSPLATTIAVGERVQLTATAHDSSGTTVPSQTFLWSSSNDAIASVGPAGQVIAHAEGSVVIAARTGSVVGTANLTVVGG